MSIILQHVTILTFFGMAPLQLMRETAPEKIFISHASPTDNYFVAWLSSKLKLLGYEVWVELDELKSGDAFWPEIESAIRNQSRKFLAVISDSYMEKIKNPVSGVFKELSCADRIKDIKGFKSPIRIAAIDEDNFPVQLMGLNSIDFLDNWQSGLDKLLESFEKEKISRNEQQNASPLNFWLDAFKINGITNSIPEKIYTNWFPFELPTKLYIHKPFVQNKLDLLDIPYSFMEYNDRHLCFFPASNYPANIECSYSVELNIQEIISQQAIPIDDFLILSDPRKKIVQLINKTVSDFFIQAKMKRHEQANTSVFYFPSNTENRKRISLKSIGKTNVAVTGKNKSNFWSFGVSSYAILYPEPYLKINSHIIFENSQEVVFDQDEHHALRRKFAFDWYNKDWLDTLLGIMFKLTGNSEEKQINIPINNANYLVIKSIPLNMDSYFGYTEPESLEKDEE